MRVYLSFPGPDSSGYAGRLWAGLRRAAEDMEIVSNDVRLVTSCDAVLALMGPSWQPSDSVCRELSAALAAGIRIVPLLVQDAKFPKDSSLPAELRPIITVKRLPLGHGTFGRDVAMLVQILTQPEVPATAGRAIIRVAGSKGGLVHKYLDSENSPARVVVDGTERGVMHLVGKSIDVEVTPGRHVVMVRAGESGGAQREVEVAPGQTLLLRASRNWLTGGISLEPGA